MTLVIVGAIVSLVVEFIKRKSGASRTKAILLTVAVSLVAGAAYQLLKDTVYWQTVLQILAFASLVYGVLIKQISSEY